MAITADASETIPSLDELDILISCDDHASEDIDEFIEYADDRYSGIKKFIESSGNVYSHIYSNTPPLPPFGLRGITAEHGGEKFHKEKDTLAETKLAQLDQFDIDYSILSGLLPLGSAQNGQAAAALANGRNSWMIEQIEDTPRLKMTLSAAGQKPAHAAEEIDRLGDEKSVVGVQLPASGYAPPISHEWYDPIYQAAQDHDLPMFFHGAVPSTSHAFPLQNRWNEIFAEDKVIVHPFSQMWNIAKMLYQGIPERFPDLDFIFQEAGIGWIPYWIWRLDYYYLAYGDEIPILNKLPSEYIKDCFYFTTQPVGHVQNPKHLAWMMEMAGPDSIMYSADFPHSDFQPPEEIFGRINGYLEADKTRGVMGETAARVLGIDGR